VSRAFGIVAKVVLLLLIGGLLAAVIAPHYLDRIYYRGPVGGHFDGERFRNPDGDADTRRPPGGGGRTGFLWRQLTGSDDRPSWPMEVPVRASRPAARVTGDRMVATWVGHATVLIQAGGLNILTDPVWAERAGPLGFGPRRIAAPGIAFADLPRIDVVVVSHNHYDHMDIATLKRLWDRDRPAIVTSLGNDAILRSRGIAARAADWGDHLYLVGGRLTDRPPVRPCQVVAGGSCGFPSINVVRNHHWGSRWFADRNRALWSAFVIRTPAGAIFFAGDTGLGDGRWPEEAARLGPIRLALIPIGAFRFEPGQMASGSHIGPVQAAEVHRRLGASTSLPIHWGTFRLSYEAYRTPPRLLAAALRCTGQSGFSAWQIGRPVEVPAYRAPSPVRAMTGETMQRCLDTPAVRALE